MNTFGPKTDSDAKAFIEAELDSIVANFEESLRRCNRVAELLMMAADRKYKRPKNSSPEQNSSMFIDISEIVSRPPRARI